MDQLFATVEDSILHGKLEKAMVELQAATPPPLCANFEKETRDQAIKKRNERRKMSTQEVPATCTGKVTGKF